VTHGDAAALLGVWGYPAYLLLFIASAFGSPLTEDLLLLLGGYLLGVRIFDWPATLITAIAGVVATDVLMYGFGRKLRQHSLRRGFISRIIRPGRLRVATRWFARFGDRLVFLARLVPGTRLVVFVSAGLRGMPVWRFLLYDVSAVLLWVPALLWVGSALGEHVAAVQLMFRWVADRIAWVLASLAVIFLVRQAWLARWQKTHEGETPP
jgi:membrane protein DedA with SNARE-associated domain